MNKYLKKGPKEYLNIFKKASSDKYANIFENTEIFKASIQIYLRPKFEYIFEYIQGQSKKNVEHMHLEDDIFWGNETKQKFQYFLLYFDYKEIIQIYLNINTNTNIYSRPEY